jgi:aspartate racemase
MKKTLGIIGGMGPLASVYFCEMLTTMQRVKTEQEYVDMLLYSKPSIPDRTAFITGKSGADPFPPMLEAAQALETAGADVIAVPCVSAHFFYEKLSAAVDTPVINIVQATVDFIRRRGIKKAGVLATDGTLRTGLFSKAMNAMGISPVEPSPEMQAALMGLIYDGVKSGDSSRRNENEKALSMLTGHLREKGAETVVLGCTELSWVARHMRRDETRTDALAVLAGESLIRCGAEMQCK